MQARGVAIAGDDANPIAATRFFTIADSQHFIGLVALVNSLRLQGHDEPITVLDLGLEPAEYAALLGECDVVQPPTGSPRHPWLSEPWACMSHQVDLVVYVDADVIVTRPLNDVISAAQSGQLCAFRDEQSTRWFAEWRSIFGLRSDLRKQTYVNTGFFAFSTACFPELLARWAECCELLVGHEIPLESGSCDSPTALRGQDALNALLMSEVAPEQLCVLPASDSAQGPTQLARTRVVDPRRLECRRRGHTIMLLHAWGRPKPWESAAKRRLRRSAYLRCLRRLLVGPDVALRSPSTSVPSWLRPGVRGTMSLWLLTQARRPWRGTRGIAVSRRRSRAA